MVNEMNSLLVEIEKRTDRYIKEERGLIERCRGWHGVPTFAKQKLRSRKNVLKAFLLDAITEIKTWEEFLKIKGLCDRLFRQKPKRFKKALETKEKEINNNSH